jgi:hypothetical protein
MDGIINVNKILVGKPEQNRLSGGLMVGGEQNLKECDVSLWTE